METFHMPDLLPHEQRIHNNLSDKIIMLFLLVLNRSSSMDYLD